MYTFTLLQVESICRHQVIYDSKIQFLHWKCSSCCSKRRKCASKALSDSHDFLKAFFLKVLKTHDFGKDLRKVFVYKILHSMFCTCT